MVVLAKTKLCGHLTVAVVYSIVTGKNAFCQLQSTVGYDLFLISVQNVFCDVDGNATHICNCTVAVQVRTGTLSFRPGSVVLLSITFF